MEKTASSKSEGKLVRKMGRTKCAARYRNSGSGVRSSYCWGYRWNIGDVAWVGGGLGRAEDGNNKPNLLEYQKATPKTVL